MKTKKVKKKVVKVPKKVVDKPYCSGTMSNSGFWSFIRSALRQKSRWWKPISDCKLKARRLYKGTNKRLKYEFQCNECKSWFPNKEINVDHIIPAGTLMKAADLPDFVTRLFCEVDNLQVLCKKCHDGKTKEEKDGRADKSDKRVPPKGTTPISRSTSGKSKGRKR